MWPRLRLDIGWDDLAFGQRSCAASHQGDSADAFSVHSMPCLSVRSGFDLLLEVLRLPVGSEVLLSAITVPDMARIVRHHRLVPVPIDLEPADLGPCLSSLQRANSPRSKLLVVAHLFGRVRAMDAIMQFAREHGLIVVEDFAQAFRGPDFLPRAAGDVALYSFGPIKLTTALGGALIHTCDRELLNLMRERQAAYPLQSRAAYLWRLMTCCALKAAMHRRPFQAIVDGCRMLAIDHERIFNRWSQNFSGEFNIEHLRRQPSAALLRLLRRRLRRFDARTANRQTHVANDIAMRLGLAPFDAGWLVPIVVDNPPAARAALRQVGVDAATAQRLAVVEPPANRPALEPRAARYLLRQAVLLPVFPEMPRDTLAAMCSAVSSYVRPQPKVYSQLNLCEPAAR